MRMLRRALLQLLLVMWALEHASVFLLLCWVTVVPLLLGVTRAADVAKRRWLVALANKQLPWLAVAAAGLGESANCETSNADSGEKSGGLCLQQQQSHGNVVRNGERDA